MWSGACQYDNRNAVDFRPMHVNGSELLSVYLPQIQGIMIQGKDSQRSAVLMDNHYEEVSRATLPDGYTLDLHKFNVQPNGRSALLTYTKNVDADARILGQEVTRKVLNSGFQEVQLDTDNIIPPVTNGCKALTHTRYMTKWPLGTALDLDGFCSNLPTKHFVKNQSLIPK